MVVASPTMKDKADAFYALHQAPGTFIIPNPWDRGSARILAHMGFKALATTSMGYAFSIGQRDNSLTREQTLANAADIVGATDLPVNADLENGFGDAPEVAAETIRLSAATGICGGSIEDATGQKDKPLFDFNLAVERVASDQLVVLLDGEPLQGLGRGHESRRWRGFDGGNGHGVHLTDYTDHFTPAQPFR